MKHILVLLAVLVIFLLPFQTVAQAETSLLQDFKQYDSFQKKYYDHTTDLIYYSSTAYQQNEHYFKENMGLWKEATEHAFNLDKEGIVSRLFDSSEYLFEKPVALISTLSDVRKYIFDKVKSYFADEEFVQYDALTVPEGYYIAVEGQCTYLEGVCVDHQFVTVAQPTRDNNYKHMAFRLSTYNGSHYYSAWYSFANATASEMQQVTNVYQKSMDGTLNLTDFFRANEIFPQQSHKMQLKKISDGSVIPYKNEVLPSGVADVFNNIINNYNPETVKALQDYTPVVQPQLVCPAGVTDLQYTDGSFYTKQRQALTVSPNETIEFNGEICNLDFEFPEIYYHDDTNKLIVGGQDFSTLPSDVVPVDNGLVDYVRNAYNYATTVINSGVNGLKSIVSGTSALVTITGSMFAFLPPEIITLFVSGFAIALGLWVFKR